MGVREDNRVHLSWKFQPPAGNISIAKIAPVEGVCQGIKCPLSLPL